MMVKDGVGKGCFLKGDGDVEEEFGFYFYLCFLGLCGWI